MLRTWLVLAALLVLCLGSSAAQAAPSFYGYTGLVFTPTADTLDANEFNLAAFAIDYDQTGRADIYSAQMGVRDGLEAGVVRVKPHSESGETLLSAKYRIQPEDDKHAGVAVGVFDPTNEIDATAYVVGSKTLGSYRAFGKEVTSLRVHGGFGGGQLDGLFLGASAGLGDRLLVMAEFVQTGGDSTVNFGARLAVTSEVRVHAAISDEIDSALGISYNKMF
jgi:hypothetical protein